MAVVNAAIIITMVVFLTVAATVKAQAEKTFYYQAGLAERSEDFIMLSLAILIQNYRQVILVIFAVMIFLPQYNASLKRQNY